MSHPIEIREEAGVRYLHFGTDWVQGAMRIAQPSRLELVYTREMFSFLLFRGTPRRALLIGLGAGSLVRFLRREMPTTRVTVVEINPAVIQIAHQYFKLPRDDARLQVEIGDGAAFMRDGNAGFDLIMVDGYDHHARPGKLESAEFYAACRTQLAPGGALVANVFGRVRGYGATRRNLAEAFGPALVALPSAMGNNVVITTFGDPPKPVTLRHLKRRADQLRSRFGLPFPKWVDALLEANPPSGQSLFR